MEQITPREAQNTVLLVAGNLLEDIFFEISKNRIRSFEDAIEQIYDSDIDDAYTIEMSLHNQLTLLEYHASDCDVFVGEVDIEGLRNRIEDMTSATIHYLAQSLALERLTELQEIMEKHGLEFNEMSRSSTLGEFPHKGERDEGDFCTVYEYRGLEGDEINIDLWHYHHKPLQVFIRQFVS